MNAGVEVRMRPATMADAAMLLQWRNDEASLRNSRGHDPISLGEHLGWLRQTLHGPSQLLLVASDDRGPVGSIRWSLMRGSLWEISLIVAPERRGEGLAVPMVRAAERALLDHAAANHLPCRWLLAYIRPANVASIRIFEAAGYEPEGPADGRGLLLYHRHPGAEGGSAAEPRRSPEV